MGAPVGVGIIGAGMISATYLQNMTSFPDLDVRIIGDLDPDRAAARAAEHAVPRSGSSEDVLDDPDVEILVNLTIPAAHADVTLAALDAGKHVWSEKPIGVSPDEAAQILQAARAAGRRVAVAPDTVLGPGMQTARRLIARGDIGEVLSAQSLFQTPGPQRFHPDPEFLFQPGAGPLFDFGPYYFSALIALLGSVQRVAATGTQPSPVRVIGSGPRAGQEFPVRVPTTVAVLAEFEDGRSGQSLFSFDSQLQRNDFVEIYGTEGTLAVGDPNTFTGPVRIARGTGTEWESVPNHGVLTGRGLGVLDLARAIRSDRQHIASAELAAHVVDVMAACEESIAEHRFVALTSTSPAVPLLPDDFDPFAQTL